MRRNAPSDILVLLPFHPDNYGPRIAEILALGSDSATAGPRPMELFPKKCTSEEMRLTLLNTDARQLFPHSRDPEAALSGLFLYFSCLKESHDLLHQFASLDGAYWHGIMHRMEGDLYNADYWFYRTVGHPAYPAVHREAVKLGYRPDAPEWDPFAFVRFCEAAARSKDDDLAKRVQLAEWQVLFDWSASPERSSR